METMRGSPEISYSSEATNEPTEVVADASDISQIWQVEKPAIMAEEIDAIGEAEVEIEQTGLSDTEIFAMCQARTNFELKRLNIILADITSQAEYANWRELTAVGEALLGVGDVHQYINAIVEYETAVSELVHAVSLSDAAVKKLGDLRE